VGWEIGEPEDPAIYPQPVAARYVEVLLGIGVPNLASLRRSKVTALRFGDRIQALDVLLWVTFHGKILIFDVRILR